MRTDVIAGVDDAVDVGNQDRVAAEVHGNHIARADLANLGHFYKAVIGHGFRISSVNIFCVYIFAVYIFAAHYRPAFLSFATEGSPLEQVQCRTIAKLP